MTPLVVGLCAFGSMVAAVLLAMGLRAWLPGHHLSRETQDAVKLGMGIVATLTAMVLGLLVASARGSLAEKDTEVKQFCARSIQLDRALRQYGEAGGAARQKLRAFMAAKIDQLWPEPGRPPAPNVDLDDVENQVRALLPEDESQRELRSDAMHIMSELQRMRWLIIEQVPSAMPLTVVGILIGWVSLLFASFALFAPRNAIAVTTLIVGALSIATALFMVLEMERPLAGLVRISSAPARQALERMDR